MRLFWRIRYLDTCEKKFKDRDLWLETDTLDNVTKTAIELTYALQDVKPRREMLRYRNLFSEKSVPKDEVESLSISSNNIHSWYIPDYFEDETGQELSRKRMATVLTDNSHAIMFPSGTKQYDIDYAISDKRPIPIAQISLSQDQLKVLGYFARDLREMLASAFYKEGPGKLTSSSGSEPQLHTAITDEEIRSFVIIFRRLYMNNEPANFIKAVNVFGAATSEYPISKWVKGIAEEYQAELNLKPDFVPFLEKDFIFTRKRLIDIFLYTQYVHQPDTTRMHQFKECLSVVDNKKSILTWLFLMALYTGSLHMRNAGVVIADFYDKYCQYHKISTDILASVINDNPGIGVLEKKNDQIDRLFQEKVEELSMKIWILNNRPSGGPTQFLNQAREQLNVAMRSENGKMSV